jgi:hypothetical protein
MRVRVSEGVHMKFVGLLAAGTVALTHMALAQCPAAVSSRCVASIPFAGNPVAVSVTDTFNNLIYVFPLNLTPPM